MFIIGVIIGFVIGYNVAKHYKVSVEKRPPEQS